MKKYRVTWSETWEFSQVVELPEGLTHEDAVAVAYRRIREITTLDIDDFERDSDGECEMEGIALLNVEPVTED